MSGQQGLLTQCILVQYYKLQHRTVFNELLDVATEIKESGIKKKKQ